MKDFNKALMETAVAEQKAEETPRPKAETRAEKRRLMKDELRLAEDKLGERQFGKRMCKEHGLPNTLKYRWGICMRVLELMEERGETDMFESAE